jgi:hypothetical protein
MCTRCARVAAITGKNVVYDKTCMDFRTRLWLVRGNCDDMISPSGT